MNEVEAFEAMAGAMAERGLVSQEQIATDRAALTAQLNGEEPPVDQTAPKPQTEAATAPAAQTPPPQGVDELSFQAFAAPATPQGYKFDRLPQGVEHNPEQELAVRQVFHEFGVPAAIAGELDRQYAKAALNPPDDQQLERGRQDCLVQINRTYGADANKVIEVARKEFKAMTARQPMLKQMAEQSGLGNSFYLISSLYNLARAKGRA